MKQLAGDGIILNNQWDKKIKTLDDLLDHAEIDKALREVLFQEVNMRTTTMNTKDWTPRQVENYQVKAKLKPISSLVDIREELLKIFWSRIPVIKWPVEKDWPTLWVINHFDLHRDRLEHKNKNYLKEINERTIKLFDILINNKIDKLIYVNWWDYRNSDIQSKTTKWTPQLNYLSDSESFVIGLRHQMELIKTFSNSIPTEAIFIWGNHDLYKMQSLADAIELYFSKANNVKIDNQPLSRKYRQWWTSTLWFAHGDNQKEKQILPTMQHESKMWKYNYFHKGHIHQRLKDEKGNLQIDTFPSPAWPSERERGNWRTQRGWIYAQIYDKSKWLLAEHKR